MATYLDPILYIYDNDEWESYGFVDQFEALISALLHFDKIELENDAVLRLFRFRSSERLELAMYERNPNANQPQIQEFYRRQFMCSILPALIRRIDPCPSAKCGRGSTDLKASPPPPVCDQREVSQFFHDMLRICSTCSHDGPRKLILHEGYRSLDAGSAFFNTEISLPSRATVNSDPSAAKKIYITAADPVALFPGSADLSTAVAKLRFCVECNYEILKSSDSQWGIYNLGELSAADSFWIAINRADFKGFDAHYVARILYAITQIVCGRDITISAHRMEGSIVNYCDTKHTLWNAYVFKMGANAQDRRCSRIYYIRTSSGAVLWDFEPDAHP